MRQRISIKWLVLLISVTIAFYLVWNERLDRLSDFFGFDIGVFAYPLLVVLLTIVLAKVVDILVHQYLGRISQHVKVADKTRNAIFAQLTQVLIYVVGFGVAGSFVPALRSLSVSLFASAGVLAIVIGLATQKTLGNLFSGLMIATYRPYRIGDRVLVGEEYGTVHDITLRHTVINTWDNRRIIIPNAKMDEETINNYTIGDPSILGWFDMDISYDSDIDLARQIMREEALNHAEFYDNRTHADVLAAADPVKVRVIGMGDSSVKVRLYFWAIDQPSAFRMKTDLMESIKKRFDKDGVEIPYPYRTLVYKKDLPKNKKAKKKTTHAAANR